MIIAIGALLAVAGGVLLLDIAGAGRALIQHVTSCSLGSLAPGYAATTGGFRVYSGLLLALGIAVIGVGVAPAQPFAGVAAIVIGGTAFVIASIAAIRGEALTYRKLSRRR